MITEGFVKTAEYKVDIKFNVPKRSYRKTWPSLQSYYVQTKIVLSSKKNSQLSIRAFVLDGIYMII